MSKTDDRSAPVGANGRPIPTMGTAPKVVTVQGVQITVHSDGRIDLPGGISLPRGSQWDEKGFITSHDKRQVYRLHDGKVTTKEKVKVPTGARDANGTFVPSGGHTTETREKVLYDSNAPVGSPTGGSRPVSDRAPVLGEKPPAPARQSAPAASRSRPAAPPLAHASAYGNFDTTPVTMGNGLAKQILDAGMGLIGTPYVWGGKDPAHGGLDCSGLISYLYTKVGGAQFNNLKTSADGQSKAGKRVAASNAQPGDLVAFDNEATRPGSDHIGIYLGNGLMLQAPHTGAAVQVVKVDLNSASAISRVLPSNAYAGLGKTAHGLTYQLPSGVTVGGTNPVKIGASIGGGSSGTGPFGLPPDPTNQQVTDAVAKHFGYLSAFMHDPEIGPILRNAAVNGWDQATLFGALYNTKWWQNTSATTRQWDADQKLDAATNRSKLAPVLADLTAQAQKAGLVLTPLQLHDISVNSLRFGWNPQQTTNALLAVGKLDVGPNAHPSDALSSKQALKQIAAQYHVPVSDAALDKWTADIIAGRMSTNDFTSYAVEQAKSLFPGLTAALDQGHSVEQYIDPYRQMAATTLDRNPDDFDFINDPKFNSALNQIDPKTGQRTSMSLSDFQTKLKADPGYGFQNTRGAKAATADLAETINQMWGNVA